LEQVVALLINLIQQVHTEIQDCLAITAHLALLCPLVAVLDTVTVTILVSLVYNKLADQAAVEVITGVM
jgi:hypothetical protein